MASRAGGFDGAVRPLLEHRFRDLGARAFPVHRNSTGGPAGAGVVGVVGATISTAAGMHAAPAGCSCSWAPTRSIV